jgi:hypothetical protein
MRKVCFGAESVAKLTPRLVSGLKRTIGSKAVGFSDMALLGLVPVDPHVSTFVYYQKIFIPSKHEIFSLIIETEGAPTTITRLACTAPSTCEPPTALMCSNGAVFGAQLQSPKYSFKGFKVTKISGTATEKGVTRAIRGGAGNDSAHYTGVFNYPTERNPGPIFTADSIPHSLPDQLYNPGGLGLGFDESAFDLLAPSAFTSFPAVSLDNLFSFGGITFDTGDYAIPGDETSPFTLHEPCQLFTVPYDSTSALTGEVLKAGEYA